MVYERKFALIVNFLFRNIVGCEIVKVTVELEHEAFSDRLGFFL